LLHDGIISRRVYSPLKERFRDLQLIAPAEEKDPEHSDVEILHLVHGWR